MYISLVFHVARSVLDTQEAMAEAAYRPWKFISPLGQKKTNNINNNNNDHFLQSLRVYNLGRKVDMTKVINCLYWSLMVL